jgi:microcystin-dependent protein
MSLKAQNFLVPVGTVDQYAGSTDPVGYFICDGRAIARNVYTELFDVIGTTYGVGDGSTTFNIPNLKARVAVGLDATSTYATNLGDTGGSDTHTLTIAELPAHKHGSVDVTGSTNGNGTTTSNGIHTHTITDPGHNHSLPQSLTALTGVGPNDDWTQGSGTNTGTSTTGITVDNAGAHTHNMGSTGGGQSHNNLQPYLVLNYIIKYT